VTIPPSPPFPQILGLSLETLVRTESRPPRTKGNGIVLSACPAPVLVAGLLPFKVVHEEPCKVPFSHILIPPPISYPVRCLFPGGSGRPPDLPNAWKVDPHPALDG